MMVLGRNELCYQEGCDTVCRQRATLQLVCSLLRQCQYFVPKRKLGREAMQEEATEDQSFNPKVSVNTFSRFCVLFSVGRRGLLTDSLTHSVYSTKATGMLVELCTSSLRSRRARKLHKENPDMCLTRSIRRFGHASIPPHAGADRWADDAKPTTEQPQGRQNQTGPSLLARDTGNSPKRTSQSSGNRNEGLHNLRTNVRP